jgi:predicted nucleic acid-binding protein
MDLVLDLNVIITIGKGVNPKNCKDEKPLRIMRDTISCSHTLHITKQIYIEYSKKFDELEGSFQINAPGLIAKAMESNKIRWESDITPQSLPNDCQASDEDKKFVELAFATDSILVTYDGGLTENCKFAKRPDEL